MSAVIEGPTATPSDPPSPSAGDGRLIAGRFRLLEPLGRGGMGRVYRARDELLGRLVAVKLIYDDAIIDSDVRHACALEARAAARLNHPGIVRILDSGFDDGHLYVVMSLAEGQTLAEVIRESGPMPAARALGIVMQVADALEAAHHEGIVHCDVKPGNLIVRTDGTVQLVDFGIARIAASTTSLDSSTLQGSAEYVAPEQVEGHAVDGRTDLYALGVVLYELLAGRTPFGGGTIASVLARRLVNDPPSIRDTAPHLPVVVDRLLRRMLARDPANRFQSASQLCAALADARRAVLAASLPPPPAASMTATLPISRLRTSTGRANIRRIALAQAARYGARLQAASDRLTVVVATAALAAIRYGQRLAANARPFWTRQRAFGNTKVFRRIRRSSLVTGVGIAIIIGLLIGTTAARCSVAGASAASAPHGEQSPQGGTLPVSTVPAVQLPATQPPAAPPARTAIPTATPPPPTQEPTPEPPAVIEPTAVPPPPSVPDSSGPVAPAVQPLAAPSGPPSEPPGQAKKPDAPAPRPESKPEAKPSGGNNQSGRSSDKQDDKPRGNNGNGGGPQKKR